MIKVMAKLSQSRTDVEEARSEELACSCAQKFCCCALDNTIVDQTNFFGHSPMEAVAVSFDLPSGDSSGLCACLETLISSTLLKLRPKCPQTLRPLCVISLELRIVAERFSHTQTRQSARRIRVFDVVLKTGER